MTAPRLGHMHESDNHRSDTWPNGNPSLTVEGPTPGKVKVDPKRRLGSFRIERR